MAKVKNKSQSRKILLIAIIVLAIALIFGRYLFKSNTQPVIQEKLATTYTGTLPCADCSGLITTLTLIKTSTQKGNYVLHEIYEGKINTPIITEGTWIITRGIPSDPNAFVLTLTSNPPGITNYLIEDSKLTLLDQNKNKIDAPFNESLTAISADKSQLANPASVNCTKIGGTLSIKTRGDGGQYGLCQFEDNMACEEWALYRKECPVGGVKTTGFDTIDQKYCAWVGGQTLAEPNATCTMPKGNICSDKDLYNGKCQ